MLSRRPEEQHISLVWLDCFIASGKLEWAYTSREYMHLRMVSLCNCTEAQFTYHHVRFPSFRILAGNDDIPEANPIATAVLTAIPLYIKQL